MRLDDGNKNSRIFSIGFSIVSSFPIKSEAFQYEFRLFSTDLFD
jgi:hypothetical protein